jgi:hypothetical protein
MSTSTLLLLLLSSLSAILTPLLFSLLTCNEMSDSAPIVHFYVTMVLQIGLALHNIGFS